MYRRSNTNNPRIIYYLCICSKSVTISCILTNHISCNNTEKRRRVNIKMFKIKNQRCPNCGVTIDEVDVTFRVDCPDCSTQLILVNIKFYQASDGEEIVVDVSKASIIRKRPYINYREPLTWLLEAVIMISLAAMLNTLIEENKAVSNLGRIIDLFAIVSVVVITLMAIMKILKVLVIIFCLILDCFIDIWNENGR